MRLCKRSVRPELRALWRPRHPDYHASCAQVADAHAPGETFHEIVPLYWRDMSAGNGKGHGRARSCRLAFAHPR